MCRRVIAVLFMCFIVVSVAPAAVVYVDADAPGPVHNGSSWATAYKSIGQAIGASKSGSHIWIADGVYRESITVPSYRRLYGGFVGCETTLDQRLVGAFRTIVDPGGKGRAIDVARGAYATIDGITVRNGRADNGAGIRCQTNTTATIANCRIENCVATQWGGGVYMATYSYGSLTNCELVHNRAPKGGGAYIEYHSYPVLRNCLIARNHATVSGGGVYCPFHAGPDFGNCTIAYNSAEVSAGGLYDQHGSPVNLTYCIIAFNAAPVGGGLYGGGAFSSLTYSYCNLYANEGGNIGGVIQPTAPGYYNTYVDPLFLMPDRNEFRLRLDSPCAGKGVYPLDSLYSLDRIGIAKLLPDNTLVRINRLVVSCADGGTTYLQSPDRSAAIAIQGLSGYHAGDLMASVTGTLSTDSEGRRILTASANTPHIGATCLPEPLGTKVPALTYTTGLRVKVWGQVARVFPGGFVLSGGGPGVSVRWPGPVSEGRLVSATGVHTLDSEVLASDVAALE